jgi:CHAD domain-containing protein
MSYRFKVNEPIPEALSRIGLEQIDTARVRLARRTDIATAIHDTRRALKRLRALLRLVRPALSDATYGREAKRLAGIGRLLADARDQHVMQQTLTKLAERFDDFPKHVRVELDKLMANGSDRKGARNSSQGRRQALQGLEQARTFFARIEGNDVTFDHLTGGLERSYRRARRAFKQAYAHPSDEAFHEWRKAVQQHWRHMQLLSRGWPEEMSGRAAEAKELSRLLGEDHDLHVALAFASKKGKAVLAEKDLAALVTMGRSLQAELREQARPRGARLFAEKADDLTERIQCYWSAARDLSAIAPANGGKRPSRTQAAKRPPTRPRRAAGTVPQAASRGSPGRGSGRPGR